MNIASHGYGDLGGSLPAIVERARQDKEWHDALSRFGYRRVRDAYAKQARETPQEILDRRLASGEIDPDAYTKARAPWLVGITRRDPAAQ